MLASVRREAPGHGAEPPAVQVYTLGGFRVLVAGQPVEEHAWRRRAARQLFKVLLTRPGRRMTRDEVVDLFWPDSDPDAASSNLRSTLYAMRHALEPGQASRAAKVIFGDYASVWLGPDAEVWTDASVFEQKVAEAWRTPDPLPLLEEASALYAGDYLPDDLYEDWAGERRDALRQTWIELQFGLAQLLEMRNDVNAALRPLRRLLRADPGDERAAQKQMKLLTRDGRRAEALRVYERLAQTLRSELDVEPSPDSVDLYRQISSGEPVAAALIPAAAFQCSYPFPAPSELVGRNVELDTCGRVLAAGRTAGRALLIAAPAGTGKSALIGQIVRQAQAQGVLCLAGGCYEERGAVPLGPFHDALVDFLMSQPAERIRELLGTSADDMAAVIPELRYHLGLSSGARFGGGSFDRLRAFSAVHSCLRALTEQGPVVIVLEDLHAADKATLQLLHHLARQTRRLALVLIATYRSDEAPPDEPLAQTVATMARERLVQRVSLNPLGRAETGQLITALLEGAASETLQESLFATTGGNPLFIEQLVPALVEAGLLEHKAGLWHSVGELQHSPAIVREVVAQRLQRLDPGCCEVLAMASVLGQLFEHRVLLAAVDPLDETTLLQYIDRGVSAQILQDTSTGYAFRHALVRDAVYWELTHAKRMLLHRRAAQVLEGFYATQADEHAAELAHHFGLAGASLEVRNKALHYNLVAGRRASSLTAYAQALTHFSRACELIEQVGNVPLETKLDALEGRGWAERELYIWPSAVSTFNRVLELTTHTGRRARARSMLVGAMLYHDTAGALDEIEAGMTELEHATASDPDTVLASLHLKALKGLIWFLRGKYRAVRSTGEDMLATASLLDRPLGLAWAHSVLAWAEQGQGHIRQALAEYGQALAAAQASQNKVQEAVVHVNLGEQFYRVGQFPQAQEHLSRAIALYKESTGELRTTDVLFREAQLSLGQGDTQRARAQAEAGLALATDAGIRWAADYHEVLGTIQSLKCEWADAEDSFLRSISIRDQIGYAAGCVKSLCGLGLTYHHRGQLERAQVSFRRALEIIESIDSGPEAVATLRHLATSRLLLVDRQGAAQYLSRAVALVTQEGLQDTLEYSPTMAVRSDMEASLGNHEAALEFAKQALASAKTVQSTVEASIRLGLLLTASGHIDVAASHARSAVSGADRLGSPLLLGLAHRTVALLAIARKDFAAANASFARALSYLESARTPLELERVKRESCGG